MFKVKINASDGAVNVWLSSDWHLLHKNISGPERPSWKNGYRDFKDEFIMTDYLIHTINHYVKPEDVLINLGDLCFKHHKRIPELRERIACRTIHHVLGNHDNHVAKYSSSFASVSDMMQLDYHGNIFVLCHYAMRVWEGQHRGYGHLYGHSHGSLDRHPNMPWGKSMDIGIDHAKLILGDYRPFHIKEIINILKRNVPDGVTRSENE